MGKDCISKSTQTKLQSTYEVDYNFCERLGVDTIKNGIFSHISQELLGAPCKMVHLWEWLGVVRHGAQCAFYLPRKAVVSVRYCDCRWGRCMECSTIAFVRMKRRQTRQSKVLPKSRHCKQEKQHINRCQTLRVLTVLRRREHVRHKTSRFGIDERRSLKVRRV